MLNLPNVTLIAVGSTKVDDSVRALIHSKKHINFSAVKIVTHELPENLPSDIIYEQCPKLKSIDEYSQYIIYNLYEHVDTEFCLLIQHDGFVIRSDKWQDEFLKWDYIGAPWNISESAYISPFGEHIRVGNGGFSLRSKKLLEVPKNINIPFEVNKSDFYKHMNANCYNEDGNICVHNRHLFEQAGCKFAPVELAVKFSQENKVPESDGIESFGFHRYIGGKYFSWDWFKK